MQEVDNDISECNISENNIGIKLSGQTQYRKHFILSYLNSSFAQKLILRRISGNAQPKLNVGDMTLIPIPIFSENFEKKISFLICFSNSISKHSEDTYTEAENLFLETIGLKNWRPSNTLSTEKKFSDFLISKRLDAEYYQNKYDELINHINYIDQDSLNSIVSINKSIEPGCEAYQDSGIPFVRVANLSKYGISDTNIFLDDESNRNTIRPIKNTILLSKDGSVGIAYKVPNDMDVITSGAILHLNIFNKDYLPDYLTLVLNSIVVRMQAERDSGGSIIPHWKQSEIEKVLIPKFAMTVQNEISMKVQESFRLRNKYKRILELTKKVVELAIEHGEDIAINYLNKNYYD